MKQRYWIGIVLFVFGLATGAGSVAGIIYLSHQFSQNTQMEERQLENQNPKVLQESPAESQISFKDWARQESKTPYQMEASLRRMLLMANESLLLEYIEESNEVDFLRASVRTNAQAEMLARLAEFNPRLAINRASKFPLVRQELFLSAIFERWAVLDVDAAINRVQSMSLPLSRTAIIAILHSRDDLSNRKRQTLSKNLVGNQNAESLINRFDTEEFLTEPETSWTAIVNDDISDDLQRNLLRAIAMHWFELDGPEIQSKLSETDIGKEIANAILHETVSKDPRYALELAGSTNPYVHIDNRKIRQKLQRLALASWVEIEPQEAIGAILASEYEIGQYEREGLLRRTIKSWAQARPQEILDSLWLLPKDFHRLAKEYATIEVAAGSFEEAVAHVEDQTIPEMTRKEIARQMLLKWSTQDPESLLDWLDNDPEVLDFLDEYLWVRTGDVWDKIPFEGPLHGLRNALQQLALSDPERALRVAVRQVERHRSSSMQGMDVAVISIVASTDLDKAVELLEAISVESQPVAYGAIAMALIEKDYEPERIVELGKRLPREDQSDFFEKSIRAWSATNPTSMYESIDLLPSAQLKAFAAETLVKYKAPLLKRQFKHLEKYVSNKTSER